MKTVLVILMATLGLQTQAQNLVKDFVAQYEGTLSYYLYQSTLRSFSDKTSDEFNKLIKDVNKISVHFLPQNKVELSSIVNFIKALEIDEFREIKTISKKEEGIYFFTSKDKDNPRTVGIYFRNGMAGIVLLEGEIDMKYVGALKEINPEKVSTFFRAEELLKNYGKENEPTDD